METETRIVETIHLPNGLTVYFEDRSRPIAGDRRQIQLVVRVPIEVRAEYFGSGAEAEEALCEFTALTSGDPVEFRVEKVRNFIDRLEADKVLDQLKEDFIRSGLGYLKNPKFAANYIRKKYGELQREHALRRAQFSSLR